CEQSGEKEPSEHAFEAGCEGRASPYDEPPQRPGEQIGEIGQDVRQIDSGRGPAGEGVVAGVLGQCGPEQHGYEQAHNIGRDHQHRGAEEPRAATAFGEDLVSF
ncbi:hypothetical protein RZS08_22415, partial [Arthrospira platensis SPKY1]|nr:hypothetical protein [Arthrospira platensis SPKY1]